MTNLFGGIKPIAVMRKTHLIVLFCLAVSVILAVVFFAPRDQTHAPTNTVSVVESLTKSNAPVPSPPAPVARATESIRTQLRLAADPGDSLEKIRQLPGVEAAVFDAKSSNLVITHPPGGPSAKTLAGLAAQAGLVVRGEVMDLPLGMEVPHLDTCGSCAFAIYEKLQKEPGVHAVEVFLPVKNQLRLLVEPASYTAAEIAGFLTESRHHATPNP